MAIAHKMHAHSELVWWLLLMLSAVALACMLAREARGGRWGDTGARLVACAAVDASACAMMKG